MRRRRLSFTQHASDVLEERRIAAAWVRRVIDQPALTLPDSHDPSLEHALAPVPEQEGRVLRVVYNRSVDPIRVVTAYFDRTMRGKL